MLYDLILIVAGVKRTIFIMSGDQAAVVVLIHIYRTVISIVIFIIFVIITRITA